MAVGTGSRACIMDAGALERTLLRLGHEIVEKHAGMATILAGIPRRGVPLAQRLERVVRHLGHPPVAVCALDVSNFRDDRPLPAEAPRTSLSDVTSQRPVAIDAAKVIVVDDVLFTGRTCRAALDALMHAGRPEAVEILVLIDRGHRQLPLKATYVGKNVPSTPEQRVSVELAEVDGTDGVWLGTR